MKRFKKILFLRILWLVLSAALLTFLITQQFYGWSMIAFPLMIWCIVRLYAWVTRSIKDMERLTDAIRYSDLNISFNPSVKKGLPEELAKKMEGSIERFKKKQLHNETEYLFYDTLLNRIDSGIMVLDKQGNIRWINKAAVDILGKPQPRKLADLKNVSSGLPEMIDRLVPKEIKLLKVNKSGSENQFAISSIFFISRGNELKLVSMKDIQPALESNESEAWRKLIRVLTHEMMNSITPIISLAETLSEAPETMDEKRYACMSRAMQTIHRRSKGLMDFVKNYQRLTRIPEPVPVNIHVSEMLADINRLLQADGIQFTYLMDAPDIQLTADRGQIEQVLINLIKNAWEAGNEKKHPDVIVHVSRNEYRKPVIEISDNGYGIVPEVLDKVFVPFFTTKQGGSGIGLSICRQIMNMHQGNITIESEMDKGTKVRLQFG